MKMKLEANTVEGRRCLLLNRIRSSESISAFSSHNGLTPSYAGQLMNGNLPLSTHSAKLMEKRLGLIPGILQNPCDASIIDTLTPSALFLNPERHTISEHGDGVDDGVLELATDLKEPDQAKSVNTQVGELRLARLRAIMGRLDVPQFCDYYGFNRPLLNSVLNRTAPFPLSLAKKLESKFKLNPGSIVYPDPSVGDEDLLGNLRTIHDSRMVTSSISPSGERLLSRLTTSLEDGDLSEGQILALTVLLRQFSGHGKALSGDDQTDSDCAQQAQLLDAENDRN